MKTKFFEQKMNLSAEETAHSMGDLYQPYFMQRPNVQNFQRITEIK